MPFPTSVTPNLTPLSSFIHRCLLFSLLGSSRSAILHFQLRLHSFLQPQPLANRRFVSWQLACLPPISSACAASYLPVSQNGNGPAFHPSSSVIVAYTNASYLRDAYR